MVPGSKRESVQTLWDMPAGILPNGFQQFHLRNRISMISRDDNGDGIPESRRAFSYDPLGNLRECFVYHHRLANLSLSSATLSHASAWKRMRYDYGLVSGKVKALYYQENQPDQWFHFYFYDPLNRLIRVQTSRDGVFREEDARYDYYPHQPLARCEIGHRRVQGLDYIYTINGWLKALNAHTLNPGADAGADGLISNSSAHPFTARDALAFQMDYFNNDYAPAQTNLSAVNQANWNLPFPLFNGNIAGTAIHQHNLPNLRRHYRYDALNRLRSVQCGTMNPASAIPLWNSTGWNEHFTYDKDGNILNLKRQSANGLMDSLSYFYFNGNNRLNHVKDAVPANAFQGDIDNQNAHNYAYDKTGNLTDDQQAQLKFHWTHYGKLRRVDTAGTWELHFEYDESGNRMSKRVNGKKEEYIIRDPQGNPLVTYELRNDSLFASEFYIYGSQRLGYLKENLYLYTNTMPLNPNTSTAKIAGPSLPLPPPITLPTHSSIHKLLYGKKRYELNDWLGNVRVAINDLKTWNNGNYYTPNVLNTTDYYAFGSQINERSYTYIAPNYRYGFNTQEKVNEIAQDHYTAKFWEYDARLGRRWNLDPVVVAWESGYAAFNNNPIYFIDPSGEEPIKRLVGTASQFRAILDNSPRKVGAFKGQEASNYLKSLGNTEFSWKQMRPLPTETGYFNNKEGRYIYTEKGGWIDMTHFMFYAGKAYQYKLDGEQNPIGEAVQDGYWQEATDKWAAPHSAYSYEDLPSDKFGADFAVNYFDPNSDVTFGEQIENYLNNVLKATTPDKAPNYKDLPTTEPDNPTRTNTTTTPVYTEDNP